MGGPQLRLPRLGVPPLRDLGAPPFEAAPAGPQWILIPLSGFIRKFLNGSTIFQKISEWIQDF